MTWWYLRASGVLIVALVLGHLFVVHYANAPSATGADFVFARWSAAFWRGFDWALLLLALTHGLAGMQGIVVDSFPHKRARSAAAALLGLIGLAFVALGTWSIASASTRVATHGPLSASAWIGAMFDAVLGALATLTYAALLAVAVVFVLRLMRGLPLEWWQFHGQWAWALHRATGIGILIFLLVHVADLALLPLAPDVYSSTVASYGNPYLMPMEIALVGAVIYHALNGVRLIVVEYLDRRATARSGVMFAAVLLATIVLVLPSIVVLVRGS